MTDNIIHGTFDLKKGYTEAELEALRIPNSHRNECLKYAVPYKRCFLANGFWRNVLGEYFNQYIDPVRISRETLLNAKHQSNCHLTQNLEPVFI